jgi:hypothetical protein
MQPATTSRPGWTKWMLGRLPTVLAIVALVALGTLGTRVVGALPAGCKANFHFNLALAGDARSAADFLRRSCGEVDLAAAQTALRVDVGFALVYGVVLTLLLLRWWPRAWRTVFLSERLRGIVWLPAVAAVFDLFENAALLIGLSSAPGDAGALQVDNRSAWFAAAFGWSKFILVGVSIAAIVAAIIARLLNLGLRPLPEPHPEEPEPRPTVKGPFRALEGRTGICLSGGGIRASSFALGGLQGLDAAGEFDTAHYLSAVSGGAYTAAAWRIARGTRTEAAQVEPAREGSRDGILDVDAPSGPGGRNLYTHVCENRRYLATGRGGLPSSVLFVVLFVALNAAIIASVTFLVAWPLGRVAAHPVILGEGLERSVDLTSGLMAPTWLWAGLAVLPLLASLFFRNRLHRLLLGFALAAGGGAVLTFLLLVGYPLLMRNAPSLVPGGGEAPGILGLVASLGIGGSIVGILIKPLAKMAPRLGGVFLGIVVLGLGVLISRRAAPVGEAWTSPTLYLAVLGLFLALWYVTSLRPVSMHGLYHGALRRTFATIQHPGRGGAVRGRTADEEHPFDLYDKAGGPQLLVCAAAQRTDRSGTGVPAVSFVFSPDEIILYDHGRREDGTLQVQKHAIDSKTYSDYLRTKYLRRHLRLNHPSAAAAISGAAFSSAMGRHSFSTTNALLGALNFGLGVWLPNPHFIEESGYQKASDPPQTGGGSQPVAPVAAVAPAAAAAPMVAVATTAPAAPVASVAQADAVAQEAPAIRFGRPRLNYLPKEVLGLYDLREPYVYVTDGGHWENLGLVELLRRGCKRIFCVDASGDAPGSAAALREALVLAEVECGVTVDIEDGLERLRPDPHTNVAEDCVAVGVIRYHHDGEHRRHPRCPVDECSTGVLFFAKAVVSRYAPDSVLTYALQDHLFPGYSTMNQFLGETQFKRLVDLGRAATQRAAVLATQLNEAQTLRDRGIVPPAEMLDESIVEVEAKLFAQGSS